MTLRTKPLEMLDGTEYKLIHNDTLTEELIQDIQKRFKAVYLGEFNYHREPAAWLFYTEIPHPEGSNYFKLVNTPAGVAIGNGIKEATATWNAVVDTVNKLALYSGSIHDYQTHEDLMIDGGSAHYTRHSLHPMIQFKIVADKFYESNVPV